MVQRSVKNVMANKNIFKMDLILHDFHLSQRCKIDTTATFKADQPKINSVNDKMIRHVSLKSD